MSALHRPSEACLALIGLLAASFVPACASFPSGEARPPLRAPAGARDGEVPLPDLVEALRANRARIPEFRILREAAEKLGIRVWLFGGTAAGYAHYVRWDLLRMRGDSRYEAARFDYDFTSVYRSTQDADLVIDGTPDQAEKFEAIVKERMAHLQGSKEDWEIRLLRRDRGDKLALLDNPDFQLQHTDSNSTGMIELTDGTNESPVRDLRDWRDLTSPEFLKDIRDGSLKFHFSPRHGETRFFREGRNPEIFSVIRYYTKAFQYELKTRPEDATRLRAIIDAFDPAEVERWHPYARSWIHKHGAKLFKHASNIEYGWNALEAVGLRAKLLRVGRVGDPGALAWWMNKEPLRTRPLGTHGKTLREVCAENGWESAEFVLAHETSDFVAYESITRDTTGRPNVWISRVGQPNEAAAYGNGFYTRVGRAGARGTGFTIRFRPELAARLGEDFIVAGDYLVVRNRAMLRTIPESLRFRPLEFVKVLADGTLQGDRGLFEKLARRLGRAGLAFDAAEEAEIADFLRSVPTERSVRLAEGLERYVYPWVPPEARMRWRKILSWNGRFESEVALLGVLADRPFEVRFRMVRAWIAKGEPKALAAITRHVLSKPEWAGYPELLESMIRKGVGWNAVWQALKQPHWSDRDDLVRLKLSLATETELDWAAFALATDQRTDLLSELVQRATAITKKRAQYLVAVSAETLALAIGKADESALAFFAAEIGNPKWKGRPELVQAVLDRSKSLDAETAIAQLARSGLRGRNWTEHPEAYAAFFDAVTRESQVHEFVANVLEENRWRDSPELYRSLVRKVSEICSARGYAGALERMAALLKLDHFRALPDLAAELVAAAVDFGGASGGGRIFAQMRAVLGFKQWAAFERDHPREFAPIRRELARGNCRSVMRRR